MRIPFATWFMLVILTALLAVEVGAEGAGPTIQTKERGYELQFDPQNLTVAPGTQVHFSPRALFAHTLTSNVPGLFDTGNTRPGNTTTFDAPMQAGRYLFHCQYHEQMTGVLTVEGTPADSPRGMPGLDSLAIMALLGGVAVLCGRSPPRPPAKLPLRSGRQSHW